MRLANSQPALVDHGAERAVASVTESAQKLGDFAAGEDLRKRFVAQGVDLFPDVPVEPEVVAVERAQSADGLVEGGGSELALILQVDEEIEHVGRWQRGEVRLREMIGELADPTVVAQAAAIGEAFELDEAGEVLIPSCRREFVCLFFISVEAG